MLALFCEHFAHAFSYPTSGVLFPNHVLFTIRLSLPPVFYFVLAVLQLFLNLVPVQTPVFVHWREDLTRCVFVAEKIESLFALVSAIPHFGFHLFQGQQQGAVIRVLDATFSLKR